MKALFIKDNTNRIIVSKARTEIRKKQLQKRS